MRDVKKGRVWGICCCILGSLFVIIIMGSPDLERSSQKNKERAQELTVLWKKERLHSTINKYIETLTFTRLQTFCSQTATFEMLNSSLRFGLDRHVLYGLSFHHELDSFQGM